MNWDSGYVRVSSILRDQGHGGGLEFAWLQRQEAGGSVPAAKNNPGVMSIKK